MILGAIVSDLAKIRIVHAEIAAGVHDEEEMSSFIATYDICAICDV